MNGITLYQNGLGIDGKLRSKSGNTFRYFLTDHLGSTVALTDSSGTIVSSTTYDSFGNAAPKQATGSAASGTGNAASSAGKATPNIATTYRYTGREYDEDTGLYYYRNRWYDPETGRFISEDPIGFAGGDINLYGYVGNNPQSFVDPFGNYACGAGGGRQDPCAKYIPKHIPPDKKTNKSVNIDDLIMKTKAKLNEFRQEAMRRAEDFATSDYLDTGAAAGVFALPLGGNHLAGPMDWWFKGQVEAGADWDFKTQGIQYEAFGNVSYGATGTAAGYSKDVLLRMGGWVQKKGNEGSKPLWGLPYIGKLSARLGWWGKYPYGDQLKDAENIKKGIAYYYCRMANPIN